MVSRWFHLQLQRLHQRRALFVIWSSGEDGHISKSWPGYQPPKGKKGLRWTRIVISRFQAVRNISWGLMTHWWAICFFKPQISDVVRTIKSGDLMTGVTHSTHTCVTAVCFKTQVGHQHNSQFSDWRGHLAVKVTCNLTEYYCQNRKPCSPPMWAAELMSRCHLLAGQRITFTKWKWNNTTKIHLKMRWWWNMSQNLINLI